MPSLFRRGLRYKFPDVTGNSTRRIFYLSHPIVVTEKSLPLATIMCVIHYLYPEVSLKDLILDLCSFCFVLMIYKHFKTANLHLFADRALFILNLNDLESKFKL